MGLPPWDLQEQKYSNISPQEARPLCSVPSGAAELSEGNQLVVLSESRVLRISSKCFEDALRASMFFYLSSWLSCQAFYITGEALQKIHMKSELLCRKQCAYVKCECEGRSVMSDSVTPWTVAHQVLLSMEFSIQIYLSGLLFPSPGDLPNSGIEPKSPTLQADSLLSEPPGKPKHTGVGHLSLLQGILLTQESNRGLLHCRWILYQRSYQGSPKHL